MSDDGFLSRWSRRKVQAQQGVALPPAAGAAQARRDAPPGALAPQGSAREPGDAPPGALAPQGSAREPADAPPAPNPTPGGREAGAGGAADPARVADRPLPPTLEDVATLSRGADISRFMAAPVDEDVKRAALKKLFADPRFNVMDGLDTYIEDYNTPRPIPPSVLRKMVQSQMLGLFDDEPAQRAPQGCSDALAPAGAPAASAQDVTSPKASPDGAGPSAVPQCATDSPAVPPDEDPDLRLQQDHAARPGGTGEGPAA